jgi:hypothetical protein
MPPRMDSTIIGVATAVGVGIGLVIHQMRQSKKNADLAARIVPALTERGPLTLPVLAEALGMGSFMGRGKVVLALNDMVAQGRVEIIDAPPGTPQLKKVDVIQYRLKG